MNIPETLAQVAGFLQLDLAQAVEQVQSDREAQLLFRRDRSEVTLRMSIVRREGYEEDRISVERSRGRSTYGASAVWEARVRGGSREEILTLSKSDATVPRGQTRVYPVNLYANYGPQAAAGKGALFQDGLLLHRAARKHWGRKFKVEGGKLLTTDHWGFNGCCWKAGPDFSLPPGSVESVSVPVGKVWLGSMGTQGGPIKTLQARTVFIPGEAAVIEAGGLSAIAGFKAAVASLRVLPVMKWGVERLV